MRPSTKDEASSSALPHMGSWDMRPHSVRRRLEHGRLWSSVFRARWTTPSSVTEIRFGARRHKSRQSAVRQIREALKPQPVRRPLCATWSRARRGGPILRASRSGACGPAAFALKLGAPVLIAIRMPPVQVATASPSRTRRVAFRRNQHRAMQSIVTRFESYIRARARPVVRVQANIQE